MPMTGGLAAMPETLMEVLEDQENAARRVLNRLEQLEAFV